MQRDWGEKKTHRELLVPCVCFAAALCLIFCFVCFPSFCHVVKYVNYYVDWAIFSFSALLLLKLMSVT